MKNLRETLEDVGASGKRVLVVGLGISGIESARFLTSRRLKVTVVEKSGEQHFRGLSKFAAELPGIQSLGVEVLFGIDGEQVAPHLANIALAVLSPGVPLESAIVGALKRHGIPYVAELELGIELHHGKALVVTGSNGKSTTSSLVDHILRHGGLRSYLCGNIGVPVISNEELLRESQSDGSLLVVEASSYQLEASAFLKPHVSVVLNISENHLERHGSLERYAAAKERALRLQTAEDLAVINADDPMVVSMSRRCRASKAVFGVASQSELGKLSSNWAHISYLASSHGRIVVSHGGIVEEYSTEHSRLLGRHNRYNMAAAILVARHMGVPQEVVQAGLESFLPLEHRLEVVHDLGGQTVINDSKSTTVAATVAALTTVLEHYQSSRVVLMIGGLSKAGSWSPLLSQILSQGAGRELSVVCFGKDGALLASHCRAAGVSHAVVPNLEQATNQVLSMTVGGGVALLSPGCASFDEFKDFEHRGAAFKNFVRSCFRQEERTSL
jgi:UDP-N-acetylmuramoylalanine--D-glutamate ligase